MKAWSSGGGGRDQGLGFGVQGLEFRSDLQPADQVHAVRKLILVDDRQSSGRLDVNRGGGEGRLMGERRSGGGRAPIVAERS